MVSSPRNSNITSSSKNDVASPDGIVVTSSTTVSDNDDTNTTLSGSSINIIDEAAPIITKKGSHDLEIDSAESIKSDNDITLAEWKVRTYLESCFPTPTEQSSTPQHDNNNLKSAPIAKDSDGMSVLPDRQFKKPNVRVDCCGTSHSLYCKRCCRLLVPNHVLPAPVFLRKKEIDSGNYLMTIKARDADMKSHEELKTNDDSISHERTTTNNNQYSNQRSLRIPFDLHIVLDDRRGAATGLHAVALLDERGGFSEQDANDILQKASNSDHTNNVHGLCGALQASFPSSEINNAGIGSSTSNNDAGSNPKEPLHMNGISNLGTQSSNCLGSVKLIDVTSGDAIPDYFRPEYQQTSSGLDGKGDEKSTTFLLFPSPGESIPIELVASTIQTLVVLDCKWTKSHVRKKKELAGLQKVHLSSPPQQSYFWRWHNAGPGMMSTIEAIYYAAMETSQQKYQHLLKSKQQPISESDSMDDYLMDQNNLIHLLWLFGHQRVAAFESARKEGKPPPCSLEGKELQRLLRKQRGTWKQLRDKEVGKVLKEECRRMKESNAAKVKEKEAPIS